MTNDQSTGVDHVKQNDGSLLGGREDPQAVPLQILPTSSREAGVVPDCNSRRKGLMK